MARALGIDFGEKRVGLALSDRSNLIASPYKTLQYLSENELADVAAATMVGGKTLKGMLGTSAWYAPGAAVASLVQSIACDQHKMFPCSVILDGEYLLNNLAICVPVILGKNGVEKIVEINIKMLI
mgnify:CR=1 FL=1